MKKIFVTGGSGFIGNYVLKELLVRDYDIHIATHTSRPSVPQEITQHRLDLMSKEQVISFFNEHQFDTLCHLAWYTGSKCHSSNSNIDWSIASLTLLKAFAESGGRHFLGAGSVSEYDFAYGYLREDETPLASPSLYGQCKASLYNMGKRYCLQNDITFQWARIFNLYGPNEKPTRLMPSVINAILRDEAVRVSDCLKYQDYLHVMDTARAIVAVLESPVQGAVNICSGAPTQLRVIVKTIAQLLHYTKPIQWGAIPSAFGDSLVVGNNERLVQEVGWEQKIPLEEGLQMTINWWREHNV